MSKESIIKASEGELSGLWGRDYGVFRQLVYSFSDEEVKVFALGKSLPKGDTPASEVQQTAYSEDEYRSVLAQMEANRGKGETPKVGIFCTRTYTI